MLEDLHCRSSMSNELKDEIMDQATIKQNGWDKMFDLMIAYKERRGHCNVPRRHIEDGIKLGEWLHRQRCLKRKKNLDVDRKELLDDIGVAWDALSEKWEIHYRLLVKFKKRKRHSIVPSTHIEDGMNLGTWLNTQRQQKKKGKLDKSIVKQLEDLGVM